MNSIFVLLGAIVLMLNVNVAKADGFDEKARAASAQQAVESRERAYNKTETEIKSDNASILRRVPRGATITKCYDRNASRYRNYPNGCWLQDTVWNGIPLQVCSGIRNESDLPPRVVECHYHFANSGRDCRIYLNPGYKPECY